MSCSGVKYALESSSLRDLNSNLGAKDSMPTDREAGLRRPEINNDVSLILFLSKAIHGSLCKYILFLKLADGCWT